jgi:dihydroflavonol-4-reductase
MKIFITGATGFIGKQVVELLLKTKHELFCLVRKTNPDKEELQKSGVHVIEGDVRDKASLLQGMKGCDIAINLANIYSWWEPDSSVYKSVNVDGTRNVMECALETKVSKVLHISSVVIYGNPSDIPFKEESTPGPVRKSKYARSKFEGDQIVWDLFKNKGLPVVFIYPAAVLGAGDSKSTGDYVSGLVKKTLPATVFVNSTLTWVYVKDVAEAIVRAMVKQGNIGEKYIVGKHQVTLGEINTLIKEISGVSLPLIKMPDFMTLSSAYMFTGISNLIKTKPLWGMAVDQMKTMRDGFKADGSKAERELGISYTPIRYALEEVIATLRK